MVDKDMSEINALKEVFPDPDILICWYHVLQLDRKPRTPSTARGPKVWVSKLKSDVGCRFDFNSSLMMPSVFLKLK
eukprot:superscaffoldBa00000650_g6307